MRRILLVMSVAALMVAMIVATAMPAFAQGRGPEGGNPGQLFKQQDRQVGAQDRTPLPFGGQTEEVLPGGNLAGLEAAGPALVCKAPGSPFFFPEICPL